MEQWQHVGILVHEWKMVDWTNLTAFLNPDFKQGIHFMAALQIVEVEGWQMCAATVENGVACYWFKRPIQ